MSLSPFLKGWKCQNEPTSIHIKFLLLNLQSVFEIAVFSFRADTDTFMSRRHNSYQVITIVVSVSWSFENATIQGLSRFHSFFGTKFHLGASIDTGVTRLRCGDGGSWSIKHRSSYVGTFLERCQVLCRCVTILKKHRKFSNQVTYIRVYALPLSMCFNTEDKTNPEPLRTALNCELPLDEIMELMP
jgi:hypothetical protein